MADWTLKARHAACPKCKRKPTEIPLAGTEGVFGWSCVCGAQGRITAGLSVPVGIQRGEHPVQVLEHRGHQHAGSESKNVLRHESASISGRDCDR